MSFKHKVLIILAAVLLLGFLKISSAQMELCQGFHQECARDEFVVGNKRMIMYHKEKTWHDAYNHCDSMGMTLLTTPTKNDVVLLKTYLNSRVWPDRAVKRFWNLWLGATDEQTEGTYEWKATNQSVTYTTWAKDEPNGKDVENCLELKLIFVEETWWNDVRCTIRRRYICEVEDHGLNK